MKRLLKITIHDRLPGLNEYINACRRNAHAGATFKQRDQDFVSWWIRQEIKSYHVKGPVFMVYKWYEKDRRRDLDNISSYGRKIIQDALVQCKILPDDGWRYITGFTDEFYVDKKYPRIEVELWQEKPKSKKSSSTCRTRAV